MHGLSVFANERVAFGVRYEDESLLVIEKPAGVVTQPGKGHARDSLLNGLFARYGALLQNLGADRDWGLLHRLDRDTSGLLLIGLRPRAYDALREAFVERRIKKSYLAIVAGIPRPAQGTVQQPILEVIRGQKIAVIGRTGQPAVTAYRVLATSNAAAGRAGDVALIEARPVTGRLHQIRVHMAHLGCPVLGDVVYGAAARMPRVSRLCLHAAELSFVHPELKKRMNVHADLPADLRGIAMRLGVR